jgi:PhnB protein
MKVMIFMKATESSEAGASPSPEALLAMHNYNEALVAAGILKDQILGGLLPTRFAKRLHFSAKDKSLTVTDGPFTETKEVIAGFALWEVKSMEEALEWAKKSPVTTDCVAEIRPLYSPETWDPV